VIAEATRVFIDYMALERSTLCAAFASHDLVGLIDTRVGFARPAACF
jgi:hypothetical protein